MGSRNAFSVPNFAKSGSKLIEEVEFDVLIVASYFSFVFFVYVLFVFVRSHIINIINNKHGEHEH